MRRYLEGLEHIAKIAKAPEQAEAKKSSLTSGLKGFFHDKFLQTKAFAMNTLDASPIVQGVKTVKAIVDDKVLQTKAFVANQIEDSEIMNAIRKPRAEVVAPKLEKVEVETELTLEEQLEADRLMVKGLEEYETNKKEASEFIEVYKNIEQYTNVVGFNEKKADKEVEKVAQEIEATATNLKRKAKNKMFIPAGLASKINVTPQQKEVSGTTKGKKDEVFANVVLQKKFSPEELHIRDEFASKLSVFEQAIARPETTVFQVSGQLATLFGVDESVILADAMGNIDSREKFVRSVLHPNEEIEIERDEEAKASKKWSARFADALDGKILDFKSKSRKQIASEEKPSEVSYIYTPWKSEKQKLVEKEALMKARAHAEDNIPENKWKIVDTVLKEGANSGLINPIQRELLEKIVAKHITLVKGITARLEDFPNMPA